MNDLHSRLSTLADELTPDPDPFAQVAGARSLHRRRRRTRAGIAGAALAVALVAVGVLAAVGTLSAPGDGEVAGPSASEALRGPADAVRSAMAWWEADGSVPDPAIGRSCSASADVLQVDSRYELEAVEQPRGSTITSCAWSTDGSGDTSPEDRVDLGLSAADELDAEEMDRYLEDRGCPWTTLFPDRTTNLLQVCEGDGQRQWTLFVLDEDGTGGWSANAFVGDDVDAGFDVAARSLGALWGVVADSSTAPEEETARRLEQVLTEGLAALAARPDPRLYARPESMACRDADAALSGPFGPDATSVTDRSTDGLVECAWVTEATGAPVTVSIRFLGRVDGGEIEDLTLAAVFGSDARGTANASTDCRTVPVSSEGVRSALAACGLAGRTQLGLGIEDAGGAGVWVLSADVPAESRLDAQGALELLVGVAEQAW